MKIDSHNHFWKYDPVAHAWIDDSMKVIRKDFLPEEFSGVLKVNGIDGTVAVQADQSEAETHFLLNLAEKSDFIKGVVGWVDLRAVDLTERLQHFSSFEKLVGFRHIVQAEPDPDFLLREDFQNGLSLLKEFGFTYDILIFPSQLEAAFKTVELHPEQKFVIDHLAKPFIKKKEIQPWAEWVQKIAASSPNVMCKLSGMVTEADWGNWKEEDFDPYLEVIVKAFGTERVMYGSDWPVCLVAAEYGQQKSITENYFSDYSEGEKAKVFGLNAQRFYGVKDGK